jgi:hypothetical protein
MWAIREKKGGARSHAVAKTYTAYSIIRMELVLINQRSNINRLYCADGQVMPGISQDRFGGNIVKVSSELAIHSIASCEEY